MGGFGSGRPSGKESTFDYAQLDVRDLQRRGLLTPGLVTTLRWNGEDGHGASITAHVEAGKLILSYTQFDDGAPESKSGTYVIQTVRTKCNYGGARAWFLCPARGCGRRVAILYGGRIFACRHCYRLTYDCQTGSAQDRSLYRAAGIRRRLGGSEDLCDPFPSRPKGMHRRTYDRLRLKGQKADDKYVGHFRIAFDRSEKLYKRFLNEAHRRS